MLVVPVNGTATATLALAQHLTTFLIGTKVWYLALVKNQTEDAALRDILLLHEHNVPECRFEGNINAWTTSTVMDQAARFGFLSVVQFLGKHSATGCLHFAMDGAAKNGHLHVLKWLHENCTEGYPRNAMPDAAENNHMDVVQYLHEVVRVEVSDSPLLWAASGGHLQVIRYLYKAGHYLPKE